MLTYDQAIRCKCIISIFSPFQSQNSVIRSNGETKVSSLFFTVANKENWFECSLSNFFCFSPSHSYRRIKILRLTIECSSTIALLRSSDPSHDTKPIILRKKILDSESLLPLDAPNLRQLEIL